MNSLLPPLPVMPGEGVRHRYMPTGDSIVSLLDADHRQFATWCAELAARPTRDDASVAIAAICRHLSAERQYLYPAIARLPEGKPTAAAEQQFQDDMSLLSDLDMMSRADPAGPLWFEALVRVHHGLTNHADVCAEHLFPALEETVTPADLVRLGNRVEIAAEAAPSRPHLKAPLQAPWNKLTDAILGAADKVVDLVTRRRTY